MPTYTYICSKSIDDGGHGEFDEFHSIRDDAVLTECILCRKEKDIATPVQRIISNNSSRGIVELTGRDLIDKTKADAEVFKREVHRNENLYANILSEAKYESLQRSIDKSKR